MATGLFAPGSWVMTREPSRVAESQTQPEPKRETPLATKSALKASRVPHCCSIWALRCPVGAGHDDEARGGHDVPNCLKYRL